jgi:hypothetical protein
MLRAFFNLLNQWDLAFENRNNRTAMLYNTQNEPNKRASLIL